MDAASLLKSQGWRGKGFSLHPSDNSVGLATPLLLSRNTDGRGVGSKPHYTSDQWWLNAFDEKLKGLDTSNKGRVVQSVTKGKLDLVASGTAQGKYAGASGLYASFVRGGLLQGTIDDDDDDDAAAEESTDATPASEDRESVPGLKDGVKKKRKDKGKETKEERRARRAARRVRKAARAARRAARAEAAQKAIRKAKCREEKQARKDRQKEGETKEERRARRAERRARKEAKRRKQQEGIGRQITS